MTDDEDAESDQDQNQYGGDSGDIEAVEQTERVEDDDGGEES